MLQTGVSLVRIAPGIALPFPLTGLVGHCRRASHPWKCRFQTHAAYPSHHFPNAALLSNSRTHCRRTQLSLPRDKASLEGCPACDRRAPARGMLTLRGQMTSLSRGGWSLTRLPMSGPARSYLHRQERKEMYAVDCGMRSCFYPSKRLTTERAIHYSAVKCTPSLFFFFEHTTSGKTSTVWRWKATPAPNKERRFHPHA
jgi:hypothetical protein